MYNVILIFDENRNKSYYHSYSESGSAMGNISVEDLPPYQDINKARSCRYEDGEWVFDEEKYNSIIFEKMKAENEAKYQLTDSMKLSAFLDSIPVEYPEEYYSRNAFPEKLGYKWKLFYYDNSFSWELVVDEDYIQAQKGKDYTNPLEWFEGVMVTEGLWYNVGDDVIWQAIKTGIPKSADDKEYFDIP